MAEQSCRKSDLEDTRPLLCAASCVSQGLVLRDNYTQDYVAGWGRDRDGSQDIGTPREHPVLSRFLAFLSVLFILK